MTVDGESQLDNSIAREVLDRLPVALLLVDLTGRVRFGNSRASTLFGVSRGELRGRAVASLVSRDDPELTGRDLSRSAPVPTGAPEAAVAALVGDLPGPAIDSSGAKAPKTMQSSEPAWETDGMSVLAARSGYAHSSEGRAVAVGLRLDSAHIGSETYLVVLLDSEALPEGYRAVPLSGANWDGDGSSEVTVSSSRAHGRVPVTEWPDGETGKRADALIDLLHSCFDVEEAYEILGASMEALLPGTAGALYAADSDASFSSSWLADVPTTFEAVVAWGGMRRGALLEVPDDCWALRRSRRYATVIHGNALRCRHATGATGWTLCLPMEARGELLGLLHVRGMDTRDESAVASRSTEESSGEVPASLLQQFAAELTNDLALALGNLELYGRLRNQSERDQLTSLYNRRYLDRVLAHDVAKLCREGRSVSVLVVDVDRFKLVNDVKGHGEGDATLRLIAHVLVNSTRAEDIVCRSGGDEFVLILPDVGKAIAVARAEQIRRSVLELGVGCTVSVGVASGPDDGATGEHLVQVADQRLYQAKGAGRNSIVSG